jgi:tetratricopeptide (TPR) repeat protein
MIEDYNSSLNLLDKIIIVINNNKKDLEEKEKTRFLFKYHKNLGKLSYRIHENNYALKNFNKSLTLLNEYNAENKNEFAEIYNYLSLIYNAQKDYNQSIMNIKQSNDLFKLVGGKHSLKAIMSLINTALIYKDNKETFKAIQELDKIIEVASNRKEIDDIYLAILYRILATCCFEMGNEQKGLSFFSKANLIHKNIGRVSEIPIYKVNEIIKNMYGLLGL